MAKNRNTFLKVQREMEKRRKAEDKRARRKKKKAEANDGSEPEISESSTTEG